MSQNTKKSRLPLQSAVTRHGATSNIVTIKVGAEKTEYVVHKAFLVYYSDYFKKALEGPWKEAEDNAITLEDVEVEVFNVFVNWLYTQQLPRNRYEWFDASEAHKSHNPEFKVDTVQYPPDFTDEWDAGGEVDDGEEDNGGDDDGFDYSDLLPQSMDLLRMETYCYADRLLVPEFRAQLGLQITSQREADVEQYEEVTQFAADNLPSSDSVYKFLVDSACAFYDPACESRDYWSSLPKEFVVECFLKLPKYHDIYRDGSSLKACDYHNHKSEEEHDACKNNND
ncbi:hypothetical protein CC80DRAFT_582457 [Byssothecium circinans]|uniref:BTB domain-containing protein n=1 Tax=Byssothecium circinans TaxID=147558 RepID=A0A6A5UG83_9PLEO|nr:hypothetical protein CC80DRAFT_582457 [Byssothecium circinans]